MKLIPTALWGAALASFLLIPRAAAADFQASGALDSASLNAALRSLGYQVTDAGNDVHTFGMYYNHITYNVDATISSSKRMVYIQTSLGSVDKITTGMAILKRTAAVSPYFFAVMADHLYLIRGYDNRGLTAERLHEGVDELLKRADQTRDLWQ